jgi:type IV pilus assembly protein PilQ
MRVGLLCGLVATSAIAGEATSLTALKVTPTSTGVDVLVTSDKPPVFNVFRLKEPDRLVVDVSSAAVDAIEGHHEGAGPVSGVVVSQFKDDRVVVGRLLFGLNGARGYDVKATAEGLVVSVEGAEHVSPPVSLAPGAGQGRSAGAGDPGELVVSSRIDEKPVKRPASRLKAVVADSGAIRLVTDGEVARFEVIELAQPRRLAIDLHGLKGAPRPTFTQRRSDVADVRVGAHPGKVRVVVEFAGDAAFDVRRQRDGIAVALTSGGAISQAQAGTAEAVIDGEAVALERSELPVRGGLAEVLSVDFKEAQEGGAVQLALRGSAQWTVDRPDSKTAVLNLSGVRIAKQLERSLDTSALQTPVQMVSAFAVPGKGDQVRVVVASQSPIEQSVTERPGALLWRLRAAGQTEQVTLEQRAAGFSTEAEEVAEEGAPQQRRNYVGKRVSFEFKDIDIHNLLRIIAEISKKNVVVADDVTGKITIRLRNVPWDQALDLVLRSKSLGKEEFGNIIRVAPLATLEAEARARAERRKNIINSTPLAVSLIPVNYATASEMAPRVKEVLSERGNVTIDQRTNTLIVRDLPDNMGKVRSLVASLDLQTPQVLIESRIVEASTRFAREVGIQWGGQGLMSGATGNPTGLVFPSSVAVTGGIVGQGPGNPNPANYAVSLPVGAGPGSGGAVGLAFGSAGGAVQLNLRLSALEAQGTVKTISAPKVTTLDNSVARIAQGVSIPFSQVSAAGANTQFVEAQLSLEVTPHITRDGSILMKLMAQNNQPDPANTGANGQPGISRKEATTQVLVKDGETTVIGGIYVRNGSTNEAGLPILSRIPVIGFFFRNHRELEIKNELLIFITPRILNRVAVAQNQ